MNLLEKLIKWASDAWNWLKNFLKKWWGRITGWWSKLKIWLKDCIQRYQEIVLLDKREDGGRELIEAIRKAQPNTISIDEIDNGPVAICIDDGNIANVVSHDADVMQEDQYDYQIAKNNGLLRITA